MAMRGFRNIYISEPSSKLLLGASAEQLLRGQKICQQQNARDKLSGKRKGR